MQFQIDDEMGTMRLPFLIEEADEIYNEYGQRGVVYSAIGLYDTPWGAREFALYDLDCHSLKF